MKYSRNKFMTSHNSLHAHKLQKRCIYNDLLHLQAQGCAVHYPAIHVLHLWMQATVQYTTLQYMHCTSDVQFVNCRVVYCTSDVQHRACNT